MGKNQSEGLLLEATLASPVFIEKDSQKLTYAYIFYLDGTDSKYKTSDAQSSAQSGKERCSEEKTSGQRQSADNKKAI